MAVTKKFKLNSVVEPFTKELFENLLTEYGNPLAYLWEDNGGARAQAISIHPMYDEDWNVLEPFTQGEIAIESYDYTESSNGFPMFNYSYLFETSITDDMKTKGVIKEGWYIPEWDDNYENIIKYTPVDDNTTIELYLTQPEDYNDNDPWEDNFILDPYFYKIVTEVVEGNPEHVEPKEIEYKIKRSTLVAIADAIREKTGSSDLIKVTDLDDAVKNLSAGGSGGRIIEVEVLPEDVSTVNENDIYKTYVLEPEKVAIPGPDSGKTITKVKFNTSLSDEEMIEIFKTVFPTLNDTENAFSHEWEETYIYYQDDNNKLRFSKDNFDSGTKWQLSIGINNGSGNFENIWGCTINKNDNTIYSSGGWTPNLDATNIDVNVNPTTLEGYDVGVHNEALKSVVYTEGEEVQVPKLYVYNNGWKELTTK